MARILVTEEIAESGLQRFAAAGHTVDVRTGLSPSELHVAIDGAQGLIIRSATIVDRCRVAGRERPARHRPGRHRSRQRRRRGRDRAWRDGGEHARVEHRLRRRAHDGAAARPGRATCPRPTPRSLPAVGSATSGRVWNWPTRRSASSASAASANWLPIGRAASACASSPTTRSCRPRKARGGGVELLPLDQVVAESDFLTIHLPKTPETIGLIGRDLLLKAKPTLRVINVARGGIVDEDALAEAIRDGIIAGAGLDVFESEPTTDSPLFGLPSVVVTPHLGASTREAQDKAGDTIADMVQLALAGDFVPFAVNLSAAEAHESLRPFLPLAERLGALFGSLVEELPATIEITVEGDIGAHDTRIVGLSALKGLFAHTSSEPVTYVNAPQRAKDAGVDVREVSSTTSARLRQPDHDQRRRSLDLGDAAGPRAPRRAAHREGRRAHVRRAARRSHADDHERRPPRRHRHRRHAARQRRCEHRRHGRRPLRHRRAGCDADRAHLARGSGHDRRPAAPPPASSA